MGSLKGTPSTSTTTSAPPPQVLAEYQWLTGQAQNVAAQNPYVPYTGQLVAGMTPDQTAAIQGMFQTPYISAPWLGQAGQNFAAGSNLINAAPSLYGAGANAYGQAQGLATGLPAAYQSYGNYMSPYINDVVNATQANFAHQNAVQGNQLLGQAIRAGNAFGGDRAGIAQAELAYNQSLAQSPVIANLYNQGFQSAIADAFQQNQQQLAAAGLLGQLGSGYAGLGAGMAGAGGQLAGIGTQAGSLGLGAGNQWLQAQLAGLQGSGIEQQTNQAALNAAYQQFMMGQAFPYQQTGWLANIASGLGSGMGGTSTATNQPGFNTSSALLGTGLMASQIPWGTIGSALMSLPIFSDERLKENIEPIGRTYSGDKVYRFNFKGNPRTQIGLLAQDVDADNAVYDHPSGYKMLDYKAATDEAADKGHFQGGGGLGYIPGYGPSLGWIPEMKPFRAGPGVPIPQAHASDNSGGLSKDTMAGIGALSKAFGPSPLTDKEVTDIGNVVDQSLQGMGDMGTILGGARGGAIGRQDGGGLDPAQIEFYHDQSEADRANQALAGMLPLKRGGHVKHPGLVEGYRLGGGFQDGGDADLGGTESRDTLLGGGGDDDLGRYGKSISGIESGGRYDLLGPLLTSGAYAGDRAYGKYQVMGRNIPEWTNRYFGQPMTPNQFLASKEAQEAVFKGEFGRLANKYGPEGAARAWFAGEGGMNDPNRRDQLGTSVGEYARRFNQGLGGQGDEIGGAEASNTLLGGDTLAPSTAPARGGLFDEQGRLFPGLSDEARQGIMAAGLAMMAGRSPNFLQNVGEGGLAGMSAYASARKLSEEAKKTQSKIEREEAQTQLERDKLTEMKRQHDVSMMQPVKIGQDVFGRDVYAVRDPRTGTYRKIDPMTGRAGEAVGQPGTAATTQQEPLSLPKLRETVGANVYELPKDSTDAKEIYDNPLTGHPVHEEVLANEPEEIKQQVRLLAQGKIAPPTSFAASKPYWQHLLSLAARYDDSFDAINYSTRMQALKDMTSGVTARNVIRPMNTVAKHLDRLDANQEKLDNWASGSWGPLTKTANQAYQWWLEHQQDPRLIAVKTDATAVANELEKAFRGNQTAISGVREWHSKMEAALSPQEMKAANREFVKLIEGQLDSVSDQWKRAFGSSREPMDFVSPKAKATFERIGADEPAKPVATPTKIESIPPIKDRVIGRKYTNKNGKTMTWTENGWE